MAIPKPDKNTPLLEADPKSCGQAWFDFFGYVDAQIKSFIASIASLTASILPAATQADQEAGASNVVSVTPGRQQFHPSAAKAWVKFTGSAVNGAQTINDNYNVSGVSRTGAGLYTVSFTTAFSSANYSAALSGTAGVVLITQIGNGSQAAGSIGLVFSNTAAAQIDPVTGMFIAFGDQ